MAATYSYEMYYRILGLAPGAPLAEIKRAYRTLAKQYHPDLNKAPDAAERFIEVNEAYEFLLRLHTVPPPRSRTARAATHRRRPHYRQPAADELFRQWMESERRKARARAAEAARKRYEEFRKSRIYRTSQIVSAAYDYIFMGIGLVIIIGSVTGLIARLNEPPDPITQTRPHLLTDITSTVFLSIIGIIFFIFAGSNILERQRRRKDDR